MRTRGMDLWRLLDNGENILISKYEITLATPLAEWAELYLYDEPETNIISENGSVSVEPTLELNLDLCWGNPEEVADVDCPESGCMYFSATRRNIGQSELEDMLNR